MADFADDPTTELERKVAALKWVAVLETLSYAVLFVFWVSGNEIGTKLTGAIHGWFFLGFAAMVLGVFRPLRWTWQFLAVAVLTGPIGAVLVYERIRREGVPEDLRGRHRAAAPADA